MNWLKVIFIAVIAVNGGGGVTKDSGVSQFWTDDYKVFEQVYGKTSDKQLYGATLPPTLSFGLGLDPFKLRSIKANEKNEKIQYDDEDITASGTQLDHGYDPDGYSDYIKLLAKQQQLKSIDQEAITPTKSTYKFIGYSGDFKPISQANDPENYSYFKHLEDLEKQQSIGFPREGVAGFKPYGYGVNNLENTKPFGYGVNNLENTKPFGYGVSNPENTDAYRSIQDILDAHEAANRVKKRPKPYKVKEEYKFLSPDSSRAKKPVRLYHGNDLGQSSRCVPGNSARCRKRSSSPTRFRSRPVVRTIKHTILSSD